MHRTDLARRIRDATYLTGAFKLRSGLVSSFYWDKYRFESDPALLADIVREMVALLPGAFDRLAGLEMGGIPLVTALSIQTGRPCLFVRKRAKRYGTCNLVEGGYLPGERVVVVEDVVTTAGQVCESVTRMRELGLNVEHAVVVIDRQQGGGEKLAAIGCSLSSVFSAGELEQLAPLP